MTFTCKGKITVTAAGTPVPLTTDPTITAHKIVISQVPATTGVVHIKNIKTGTAIIVRSFLAPGASGFLDEHCIEADDLSNPLYPADWAIDAVTNNDGAYVYWETV